jgi:alkylation response protein AidB-like acyl-CoA dehydrogenase
MTDFAGPRPSAPDDDKFVGLARELGEAFAPRAAAHDLDNTFVSENYDDMRNAGYLRLAVPEELGGLGANIHQVCYAQAELARHCGATALAVNMHLYITLLQAFRRRSGAPDAESVLRRVNDDGVILMTSGGSDWLWPTGEAVEVEGGYRVSGRKAFCSQAPVANVLTTSAPLRHDDGRVEVLMFGLPMTTEGVDIIETWDTLGMRATSSHDIEFRDVVIPSERVIARRGWNALDGPLLAAAVHIAPTVASVYWGVARAAREESVRIVSKRKRGDTAMAEIPSVQRTVGLMDNKLHASWWALVGSLDVLRGDYKCDAPTVTTIMHGKRVVVEEAVAVTDLAMEVVGGASYFRTSPLQRYSRDARAGKFHPLTPEATLSYAGRLVLGQPVDTE